MPSPSPSSSLTFRPLSPALGVEVGGLDLEAGLDEAAGARLREAYDRHHLLLFRGRPVSASAQAELARLFGEIAVREKNTVAPERADTQHVSNTREDGILGLGELDFHTDQLFHAKPLSALILYAVEVPAKGGDTRFCNTSQVYDNLPADLKQRIEGRSCRHEYNYGEELKALWKVEASGAGSPSAVHPIVFTDPRTGQHGLWVNGITTVEVLGMDRAAGRALVDEVRSHIRNDAAIYTHRWQPHDLVLWNNLILHHARTPFDASERRTLRRTPIV